MDAPIKMSEFFGTCLAIRKPKTLVTVLLQGGIVRRSFARRVSNRALWLKNQQFPNSDKVLLEDKYGHRYARALPINPDND